MDVQAHNEMTITVRLTEREARELYRDLQHAEFLPGASMATSRLCVLLLGVFTGTDKPTITDGDDSGGGICRQPTIPPGSMPTLEDGTPG